MCKPTGFKSVPTNHSWSFILLIRGSALQASCLLPKLPSLVSSSFKRTLELCFCDPTEWGVKNRARRVCIDMPHRLSRGKCQNEWLRSPLCLSLILVRGMLQISSAAPHWGPDTWRRREAATLNFNWFTTLANGTLGHVQVKGRSEGNIRKHRGKRIRKTRK